MRVSGPAHFEIPLNGVDRFVMRLAYLQRERGVGKLARWLLRWHGTDIDPRVLSAPGLRLPHAGTGVVIHPDTRIGRDVTVFQHVTVGRARIWEPQAESFAGAYLGDGAILCAGAVVLVDNEPLTIGAGTVVGANAVLTQSTGEHEIWAGVPARRISRTGRLESTEAGTTVSAG